MKKILLLKEKVLTQDGRTSGWGSRRYLDIRGDGASDGGGSLTRRKPPCFRGSQMLGAKCPKGSKQGSFGLFQVKL